MKGLYFYKEVYAEQVYIWEIEVKIHTLKIHYNMTNSMKFTYPC